MTENPVRFRYTCARALLHMPITKRCISCEIQNSIALAGLHFSVEKRHRVDLCYACNRYIYFSCGSVRVTYPTLVLP